MRIFSILFFLSSIALGGSPIIWSGTSAKLLPSGLHSAGIAHISATGIITSSGIVVGDLNSGTSASASTFFRGDGIWSTAVTGIDLNLPGIFSVSGGPVTTSGTISATLATQSANQIFSGPVSGIAATPAFRGLVSLDIPNNAANTTGTASNVTSTVAVGNGGTGATTATAAFNNLISVGGSDGQYLKRVGGIPTWADVVAGVGTVTSVGLSVPGFLSVSGSPVTGSGNIAVSMATPTISGANAPTIPITSIVAMSTGSKDPGLLIYSEPEENSSLVLISPDGSNYISGYRANGTLLSPTTVTNGQDLLNIQAVGHDGSDYAIATEILFQSDGAWTGSAHPTRLIIKASGASGVRGEVFRIDGAGVLTLVGYGAGFAKFNSSGVISSAALVSGDIPNNAANTSGTSANVTGTVALANGGTGQITALASFNALSGLTTLGDTLYGGASGTRTRLAGNTTTTKKFLTQTGDATNSAAPGWNVLVSGDIPNNAANTSGTSLNVTGTVAIANGGTGQTAKTAAFDALSPLTTQGDLIYFDGTNNVRLPKGTTSQVLTMTATIPSWAAAAGGGVTGPGSSTDKAIAIYSGTGGGTLLDSTVTIPSSGKLNVGTILAMGGTSPPVGSVTANSTGGTGPAFLALNNTGRAYITAVGATDYAEFAGYRVNTSLTSPTIVAGGELISLFSAYGYNGSGYTRSGYLAFQGENTWTAATQYPTKAILALTADASTSPATVFTFSGMGSLNLHKASGANITWSTNGGGNIGTSTASGSPDNIYSKSAITSGTSMVVGTTLTLAASSSANLLWTTNGGGNIGTSIAAGSPNNIFSKLLITAGTGLVATTTLSVGTTATITTSLAVPTITNTAGVAIQGTNTNSNAASGYVGEYFSAVSGDGVYGGTTGNYYDQLTITAMPAGDYDCYGSVDTYNTTFTGVFLGISVGTSGNTFSDRTDARNAWAFNTAGSDERSFRTTPVRVSLSAAHDVYLKTALTFVTGTAKTGSSYLACRRMR